MPEPSKIDVGELTEAVVTAVRRALAERQANDPPVFRNPRILTGIIMEPTAFREEE